jgi:hypothetical protein
MMNGISVHARHKLLKKISEILKGYQRDSENNGYEILRVKGWDYSDLITTYEKAATIAKRRTRSCFSSRKRINTTTRTF